LIVIGILVEINEGFLQFLGLESSMLSQML